MSTAFSAFVDWPFAPLTERLVTRALQSLPDKPSEVGSDLTSLNKSRCLQWSSYDSIDHDLTLANPTTVLSSSYTIRKALIRKHFLHRCIHSYTVKNPHSILSSTVPKTWDIDISYADELEELWSDDLWDLGNELDAQSESETKKWWILKPSMADRGMGIRLFDSKDALRDIFEGFDEDTDSENEGENDSLPGDTSVFTSQLRYFVIQEYLHNPVLIDPNEVHTTGSENEPIKSDLQGHKFHLRAYCIASGDLTVYLYKRVLALFSAVPYSQPGTATDLDLRPHLTNTCLQNDHDERNVRLLDELVGCQLLSSSNEAHFTDSDKNSLIDQMAEILANTFEAAVQNPVHFQALPNAFELYGVDFLVTQESAAGTGALQAKLLEVNAEPAIEMTGPRLTWVLEDLFKAIADTCVEPFFRNHHPRSTSEEKEPKKADEKEVLLRECYKRQRWA
ncbi:tubulin-tyrosine ligase [Schizopora paradoxa]|uniref:Tubulin-tyrosine ligase n=1 Tax=Schizopora paradoxa TaxID=27342 RepID=A0A0H2RRM0_9AGAM|nr:tubulin-tyrosine ligase [Schizopora paradoxa]